MPVPVSAGVSSESNNAMSQSEDEDDVNSNIINNSDQPEAKKSGNTLSSLLCAYESSGSSSD